MAMTDICPCGQPARGFRYMRGAIDVPACSMRCLDRLVQLKGIVPAKEAAHGR